MYVKHICAKNEMYYDVFEVEFWEYLYIKLRKVAESKITSLATFKNFIIQPQVYLVENWNVVLIQVCFTYKSSSVAIFWLSIC